MNAVRAYKTAPSALSHRRLVHRGGAVGTGYTTNPGGTVCRRHSHPALSARVVCPILCCSKPCLHRLQRTMPHRTMPHRYHLACHLQTIVQSLHSCGPFWMGLRRQHSVTMPTMPCTVQCRSTPHCHPAVRRLCMQFPTYRWRRTFGAWHSLESSTATTQPKRREDQGRQAGRPLVRRTSRAGAAAHVSIRLCTAKIVIVRSKSISMRPPTRLKVLVPRGRGNIFKIGKIMQTIIFNLLKIQLEQALPEPIPHLLLQLVPLVGVAVGAPPLPLMVRHRKQNLALPLELCQNLALARQAALLRPALLRPTPLRPVAVAVAHLAKPSALLPGSVGAQRARRRLSALRGVPPGDARTGSRLPPPRPRPPASSPTVSKAGGMETGLAASAGDRSATAGCPQQKSC